MNRDKAIRNGFYDTLKDQLTYDSNPVHIYDSATSGEVAGENIYVLLTSQSSVNDGNYRQFRWNSVQAIEIVSKQISSVSKDIVDDISEQIEQLLIYASGQTGKGSLTAQQGWEFDDLLLESTNYIDFQLNTNDWEITKVLQFSLIVTKLS